ncbi:MAG TPA: winged-helix domain-containing protein, partial [Smithellaceae bacterium]|nr:winged-helix domain-containing protein [Smithellaceae bacterium]
MKDLLKPEEIERKVLLILRILNESADPLGARVLARLMKERGTELSERTVRYHLKLMDERGLTRLAGRRDGRVISARGQSELADARVQD